MKRLLFFLILIFVFSCKESSTFNKIISSEKGDFRGVSIRNTLNEVKVVEKIQPKNEESDYLFYEFPLGNNSEYYTLGYSFNEKGLYEILLDVYQPELFAQFKEHFTNRFGTPSQEEETTVVWLIKTELSEEVEVTLTVESDETGKLSISFYDLAY